MHDYASSTSLSRLCFLQRFKVESFCLAHVDVTVSVHMDLVRISIIKHFNLKQTKRTRAQCHRQHYVQK